MVMALPPGLRAYLCRDCSLQITTAGYIQGHLLCCAGLNFTTPPCVTSKESMHDSADLMSGTSVLMSAVGTSVRCYYG